MARRLCASRAASISSAGVVSSEMRNEASVDRAFLAAPARPDTLRRHARIGRVAAPHQGAAALAALRAGEHQRLPADHLVVARRRGGGGLFGRLGRRGATRVAGAPASLATL